MTTHTRRYVFLDFDTLLNIKFKKLEKVCDKIFVFVGFEITDVPFALVRDMQSMGDAIKWVEVGATLTHDLNYHICFLMGKLHEKISGDVEFAILSNDIAFDPLVNFINSTGRSCVRIKNTTTEKPTPPQKMSTTDPLSMASNKADKNGVEPKPVTHSVLDSLNTRLFGEHISETDEEERVQANGEYTLIEETARETVRRLVRSGNRPQNVTMLRNYILLHNQELSLHGDVDKIISRLKDSNDIELNNGAVQYNF